jgi:predicted transglutaminase-like cysteine proteinase
MQKFEEVINCINKLEFTTREIHLLLLKADGMNTMDTDNIKSLYEQKGKLLSEINEFINSDIGNSEIMSHKEEWRYVIMHLKESDGNNLNLMRARLDILAEKLKKMNSVKSVLIYQK